MFQSENRVAKNDWIGKNRKNRAKYGSPPKVAAWKKKIQ